MGDGINPAWESILEAVGEDSRDSVSETLSQWDTNYNSLQEQYSGLKPWEDLSQHGITPEQASYAIQVATAMNQNPSEFIKTLAQEAQINPAELFGLQQDNSQDKHQEQGNASPVQNAGLPPEIQAQLDNLAQQNELMANILKQNLDAQAQKRADEELSNEINNLQTEYKNKFGYGFDERMVLGLTLNGMELKAAVDAYYNHANQLRQDGIVPAPMVLGGPGSVNQQTNSGPKPIDVSKLEGDDRSAVFAKLMRNYER